MFSSAKMQVRLLVVVSLLQVADYVTTQGVIASGGGESNVVVIYFGAWWWVPKAAISSAILLAGIYLYRISFPLKRSRVWTTWSVTIGYSILVGYNALNYYLG